MRNRRVTVQWYDDEFEAHFFDMPVPITYKRKDIDVAVDKELLGRGVADYRWNIADDISHVLVNKITDLLEKENWRYRIIQDDSDMFVFQLTDYYCGYVQFDVDLIDFTIGLSYDANVTDQEMKKAAVVFTAVSKILRDVQAKIKE